MKLLAHRGYAEAYPENSLSALSAALGAGAHALEFDVQLTRDAVPILLHDASFARTGGVERLAAEVTSTELAGISVGEHARFGERFAGEPVPRLDETAARLAAQVPCTVFAELKRESVARFGAARVVDAAARALVPLSGRCVIISFLVEVLELARQTAAWPIGWCLDGYDGSVRARAEALRPEFLVADTRQLPDEDAVLWPGGWRWVVYEVTEPGAAQALGRRGVEFIETMRVGSMLASGLFEDG